MEIPSWAGKVATVAGLTNPITAPVVVGQWVAEKANSALGSKTETPVTAPARPEKPEQPHVANEKGQVTPSYTQSDTLGNGNQKLVGADGKWNGSEILNGQTQFNKNDPSAANEQENRCGPSVVLASQVMKGPEATGKMVGNLAAKYPEGSPERQELDGIQKRIAGGTATHDDLSRVQHQMYQKYHPADQADGLTPGQIGAMERDLCGAQKEWRLGDKDVNGSYRHTDKDGDGVSETSDNMQARLNNLKPGESFVQFVDTTGSHQANNHYVLMGKDKDGRPYAYDPGAKTNQPQMVFQDERPQGYDQYANGAMGTDLNGHRIQTMAGSTLR